MGFSTYHVVWVVDENKFVVKPPSLRYGILFWKLELILIISVVALIEVRIIFKNTDTRACRFLDGLPTGLLCG